jgi:hypothetical protein
MHCAKLDPSLSGAVTERAVFCLVFFAEPSNSAVQPVLGGSKMHCAKMDPSLSGANPVSERAVLSLWTTDVRPERVGVACETRRGMRVKG